MWRPENAAVGSDAPQRSASISVAASYGKQSGRLEAVAMGDIFVQSLIDVELWDSARWKGTAFLHDPRGTEPPGLGLLFDDMRSGKRIFSGWQERVGKADRYEEIRVSVIRGEILGLASGY